MVDCGALCQPALPKSKRLLTRAEKMSRFRKILPLAALLIGFSTASVYAECDCAQTSDRRAFKCADAVFIGTAIDGGRTTAVDVGVVFKGKPQQQIVVSSADGDCYFSFQAHREYVFYVYRGTDATTEYLAVWKTSACSHSFALDTPGAAAEIAQLRHRAWWWRLPLSGWCR
jgi:hypothetical protein